MNPSNVDTFYVMADGTHADPAEIENKDGKLQGKNGVPVVMRVNGLPMTSGVATKTNKMAAEAGYKAEEEARLAKETEAKRVADEAAAEAKRVAEIKANRRSRQGAADPAKPGTEADRQIESGATDPAKTYETR